MIGKTSKTSVRSKIRWGIVGIIALFFASAIFVYPQLFNKGINWSNEKTHLGFPVAPVSDFKLGLDLQGGAQLVYEAKLESIEEKDKAQAVEGVRDVIERRVNGMGVSEPQVQTTKVGDSYRLVIELPGVANVEQAIAMIGETPILEFKEINTEPPRELTADEQKQLAEFNADAEKRAKVLLQRLQKGETIENIAKESSEDDISKNNGGYMNFVGTQTVYPELYAWAQTAQSGEISKTAVSSVEGYNILKKGSERDGKKEINASHILVCYLGATGCGEPKYNKEEALEKAREIFNQANGANFVQLAKENSDDISNKDNGGDLGWFAQGYMVETFDNAVFSAAKGEIIGPVETEFGFHVIYKKDERVTKEYELWRVLVRTQNEYDIVPPQDEWKATGLSGKQLQRSEVVTDQQTGQILVSLSFNNEGKQLFADITRRNVKKPLAIFLDQKSIVDTTGDGIIDERDVYAPEVQTAILDGRAVISGNLTLDGAKTITQRLNAGALPIPVELISQQTIGATLGTISLTKSLKAGIFGVMIIMLFMFAYYRLPGFLSVISLSLYITLTLALFKLIGVTLTLAGIAGFVMSIGMAVDANVLIFERMKEELKGKKSLKASVEEGFKRAWSSIRDSNVSTLISCVLLMWFGTSFVKGFAVTLSIGVLISMFSAITVTRVLLRFIVPWFSYYGNRMFLGGSKPIKESK